MDWAVAAVNGEDGSLLWCCVAHTHTHRQTVQDGIVQDTHARPLAEGEWRELVSESE